MDLKKAIQAVSSMDGYEAKIKGASDENTYTQTALISQRNHNKNER